MHPYLLPVVELSPKVFQSILDEFPPELMDARPDANRFTPREVFAHMADWEPILLGRIRTAYNTPGGAAIQAIDEGQMAIDHGYAASEPAEQMRKFAEARKETSQFLRELTAFDWSKSVNHPERGVQTIYDMANLFLGHDLYHIEQLVSIK